MFIDETGIDHQIIKDHCWAPRGTKIICEKSGKARGRTSLIAGLCNGKPIAPFCFKGHMNTEVFIDWLEKILLPGLFEGQVVVMDNASFHKSQKIRDLIEKSGCKLVYLPAYSPDLNPIENYWAWLKRKIKCLRLNEPVFDKCLDIVSNMKYKKTLN